MKYGSKGYYVVKATTPQHYITVEEERVCV